MHRISRAAALFLLLAAMLLSGYSDRTRTSPSPASEPTSSIIRALDRKFTGEETVLDLRGVDPERLEEVLALLPQLPRLERIELAPEEETDDWPLEALSRLREAADEEIVLNCSFRLFGRRVSSAEEEIVYFREDLGDKQLPALRQALPLLSGCRRLLLDDCGFTYEELARLREAWPERGLCWRVRFGIDSALTDTDTLWTVSIRDENCDVLKYCTEVLYLDVGEIRPLTDFSFLAYMTKLQVVVLSHSNFEDCELLTHCPDLEFLEIDYTPIHDLSPLTKCTSLEYLSIENLLELTDISPLYGLTNLKCMRISVVPNVSKEQRAELVSRLPNCDLIQESERYRWRYDAMGNIVPRYALLREQIGYNGRYLPTDSIDMAYVYSKGYTWQSVFTAS